jgi:uncharacterized protein YdaU (DUF1376 family)
MFYYQHHIGDFIKDTSNLDDHQLATYLRMMWIYYTEEKPFSDDAEDIAFAVRSDEKTVRLLMRHFFENVANEWCHKRCDREISEYHSKSEKARESANARWSNAKAKRAHNERNADATVFNANQEPRTNNQEPVIKEANASLSEPRFPTCPQQEILKLWAKHLPHLSQPRVWEGARQTNLRSRWVQASKPSIFSPEGYKTVPDGLEWWEEFFKYIANDTKLANGFESNGRNWRPDLEWVVNAANFQKIIDGKYDK